MRHPILSSAVLFKGQSYWKIRLSSGKEFSELDSSFDFLRGKRKVDWFLDVISTGSLREIKSITMCTPEGDITLEVYEPYTAFQFKRGTLLGFGASERIANAHIIGRVDNLETGECTAAVWDIVAQKLYQKHVTNIKDFSSWRTDVIPIGRLSIENLGIRLK